MGTNLLWVITDWAELISKKGWIEVWPIIIEFISFLIHWLIISHLRIWIIAPCFCLLVVLTRIYQNLSDLKLFGLEIYLAMMWWLGRGYLKMMALLLSLLLGNGKVQNWPSRFGIINILARFNLRLNVWWTKLPKYKTFLIPWQMRPWSNLSKKLSKNSCLERRFYGSKNLGSFGWPVPIWIPNFFMLPLLAVEGIVLFLFWKLLMVVF